jgi:hypothetical protein
MMAGQQEKDNQNRTPKTRQPEQDSWGLGQPGQDSTGRSVWKVGLTGQSGLDREERIPRTLQQGQDNRNWDNHVRTVGPGRPEGKPRQVGLTGQLRQRGQPIFMLDL